MSNFFRSKRNAIASLAALGFISYFGYKYYVSLAESNQVETSKDERKPKPQKDTPKDTHTVKETQSAPKQEPKVESKEQEKPSTVDEKSSSKTEDDQPSLNILDKLDTLSEEEKEKLAEDFKLKGNESFNEKQFDKALELYTAAIKCNPKNAVFFSNRAAVYGSLNDFENVVKDTTEALNLRSDYIKCYTRRAVAYEKLNEYEGAVMDYTSACILKNFEDDTLNMSVDKNLGLLAEQKVDKLKPSTLNEFPSASFIKAYLSSFTTPKLPESVINAVEGESDAVSSEFELKLAFDALEKGNRESYKQAFDHIKKSIDANLPSKELNALAYEYRATFEYLQNDIDSSLESMKKSIEYQPRCSVYLKRANLYIELEKMEEALADFEHARETDAESPDLYYQLGQFGFLRSEWKEAVENYKRCIEIDNSFILAHIQLAVTLYKLGDTDACKRHFVDLIAKYPKDASIYNYYGEVLTDAKDTTEAVNMFDKSVELEKENCSDSGCVLPMINKALALVQVAASAADIEKVLDICRQARTLDPQSSLVVTTLAQFELQQGNVQEAIELFELNAKLVRTRAEQIQAYTFAEAARAQLKIGSERPAIRERLVQLSKLAGQM